ncbi:MAG: M20/M25/M40 family metallo-hydrolase [Chloroflexota bacterium]
MASPIRSIAWLVAGVLVAGGCGAPVQPSASSTATSRPSAEATAPAPDPSAVAQAITEGGLRADLAMLVAAGSQATSFRALGSAGYDTAADSVAGILRSAGWTVSEDRFTASAFTDDGASSLVVGGKTFGRDDLRPLIYAPSGTAEGPVVTIGWAAGEAAPGGLGCEVADYGTLPAHAVVVVGPDDCYRRQAVAAAQSAGASAFVAVIAGNPPGAPLRPTLISTDGMSIPAVAVSADAANALRLAAERGGSARIASTARTADVQTRSIIGELPGAVPGPVVMLGAHLDSVMDGPGANDNGSGVAALLAIARALAGTQPQTTIRLAFWSGEEEGLFGSAHFVTKLSDADRASIVAYLNADMLGSPNGFAGVYDEPNSPSGSASIGALLDASLGRLGARSVPVDTGGGSDHTPFVRAGVAIGGLFSGAGEPLTAEQAATFGGTAGQPADACYHRACDTLDNVRLPLARILAAALADAALQIAAKPALVVP